MIIYIHYFIGTEHLVFESDGPTEADAVAAFHLAVPDTHIVMIERVY